MRLLVTRFIPLKPTDLEGWQDDPEDWVNHEEQDNDMWEYEIRVSSSSIITMCHAHFDFVKPCAERVLMVITNQYHQLVVPYLFQIFKDIVCMSRVPLHCFCA